MTPVFDGRAWTGMAEAYGTTFLIELFESKKHPGYYHYGMVCLDDDFANESDKPIRATAVLEIIKLGLSQTHGLALSDVRWKVTKPEELPLSKERVAAGA